MYRLPCGYSRWLFVCTLDLTASKQTRFLILGTFTQCNAELTGKCKKIFCACYRPVWVFNITKLLEPQIKQQAKKQDSLSLAHSPNATLKKKINVIQTGMKANPYHTQAHCKWRKSAVTFSVSRKNSFVFNRGDIKAEAN